MARKATGQVIEPTGKQRSWALRFRAYGKRRFLALGRPRGAGTANAPRRSYAMSSRMSSAASGSPTPPHR
jgi:hypothetical protein